MNDAANPQTLWQAGIDQFNLGEYFECHETLEELWHDTDASEPLDVSSPLKRKEFIQGILQLAVVLVHLKRGNARGVKSVWRTASDHLQKTPPLAMGIDVRSLLNDMESVVKPVLKLGPERFEPGATRRELPWNEWNRPKIKRV